MGAGGHRFGLARTVIPANGEVFVDAMVAGTFAARGLYPVLLTPPDRLHPAVEVFIDSDLVERVLIMGGLAAVSAEVELGPLSVRMSSTATLLDQNHPWASR